MFEIDHRLGTGFIREIAKFYCPKTPELFYHTWELADRLNTSPYEGFKIQADLLNVPINSLIKRANEEGTSIIIEGNHLIPEIMTRTKATTCLVLNVSDEKEHYNHILGKSHANRTITKENFSTIRKVQKSILSVAKRHNVPIIENNDLTDTLNKITVLLGIDLLPHVIS